VVYLNKSVTTFAWIDRGKTRLSYVRLSINPTKIWNWIHTDTIAEYYSYTLLHSLRMGSTPYVRWSFRMPNNGSCSQRNWLLLNFVGTGNTRTHSHGHTQNEVMNLQIGFFGTGQLTYKWIRTLKQNRN
jgi:hypothetical protein